MGVPGNANALLLRSAAAAGGYQVSRSLRFNSSDSAFCSFLPSTSGNRKKWTLSIWVKRSRLGASQAILHLYNYPTPAYYDTNFAFNSSDQLVFNNYDTSAWNGQLTTAAVFRDCSAWYHIVCSCDTDAATPIKIYVNNVQQTLTGTQPSAGSNTGFSYTATHRLGINYDVGNGLTNGFNGYFADPIFIDSQALTPSSFTEVSATTGQLVPKAYTGSFGTNGFWLKFSDNSGTTSTTLGKDSAGSNNWTPNNFSVAAGAGNDSLVDTPTSYGTDTGAGGEVRGNYATWNPLISSTNLTNGNLSVVQPSTTGASRYSTLGMSTGKWYWEISVVKYSNTVFGIRTPGGGTLETPYDSSGYGMGWRTAGGFFIGGSNTGTGSMSLVAGDVLGLAFDADAGTLKFYKNGTLNNTLTASSTYIGQTWFAGSQDSGGGNSDHDVNFGQRSWAYAPPSGHKALCDTNLPSPLIAKPNSAFDCVTYTGTGATLTPTSSLGFSPDLVWIKSRSAATDNTIYDAVRGTQARLESNNTDPEVTSDGGLTAFNNNGFTLGTLAQVNTNAATYVAWCWDEAAADGFDIVTYTGNGANRTIAHSLGVAPSFMIVKQRTAASATNWAVWHSSLANTEYLLLNSTAAKATGATYWNSTSPTSTNFSLGTAADVNTNNGTYVAYLWSSVVGYSAMGSYAASGNSDGPFQWCGFRPRWVMLKRSDSTESWIIIDAARDTYNLSGNNLFPNTSGAEVPPNASLDILSNGFKLRSTVGGGNVSGGTYVWAAFAESPFQYARAR